MKIAVVGLGSMGKRRIRLIRTFFPEIEIFGIDNREDRRAEVKELFSAESLPSIEAASGCDALFVCTDPIHHAAIIKEALSNNLNIFTELNLVSDGYEENMKTAKEKGLTLFLSSTQLYRREINYIKKKTDRKKVSYTYHIGQYLPDWHPWENFSDFFVGNKRTNGCREIFAVELPWIVDAFSEVVDCYAVSDKLSTLDLPYPDSFHVILKHKNGTVGNMTVDVVARNPVRRLEVLNEQMHIIWEGSPSTLYDYNTQNKKLESISLYDEIMRDERYSNNIIEDAYLDEIKMFFDVLRGGEAPWSFERDLEVLNLIDKIEGIE